MDSKKVSWPEVLVLIGILVVLGALVVPGFFQTARASYERGAAAKLKVIAITQEDFRRNDRDGSGVKHYWRKDIGGLYALKAKDGTALALIPKSFALADDRPQFENRLAPMPVHCDYYRFRALRFSDEKTPDPDRWAACAVPDPEGDCRYVFITSHKEVIFRKAADRVRDLEFFPADPLKEGWEKVD